jgi:hypothetical protein
MKARNEMMVAVRDYIRFPYSIGGYPKVLVMSDGECMCAECAKDNYRLISEATRTFGDWSGWAAAGVEIYWEGPALNCANCSKDIESAYGDPEMGDM